MSKQYKYFISYSFPMGFGNSYVDMNYEIKSGDDILEIGKSIEEEMKINDVVILYWREF